MSNFWLSRASLPKHYPDGTVIWLRRGSVKHRNGDLPACEFADGAKQWFKNGRLHRENGPACIYPDGSTEWYFDGDKHRGNGPACEYADGTKQWWAFGQRIK